MTDNGKTHFADERTLAHIDSLRQHVESLRAKLEAAEARAAMHERDSLRYNRLRVLGCAIYGHAEIENGYVARFQTVDTILDDDLRNYLTRGEFKRNASDWRSYHDSELEAAIRKDERKKALEDVSVRVATKPPQLSAIEVIRAMKEEKP